MTGTWESVATVDQGARGYGAQHLPALARRYGLSSELLWTMRVVSAVLPFRTSQYVLDNLIDWSAVPDDPIFRLVFPQEGMLAPEDFAIVGGLLAEGDEDRVAAAVRAIRERLDPDPGDQLERNAVARSATRPGGLQHKYRRTVLFFPSGGQTCHSYCNYCFRWPQFIGEPSLRFAESDASLLPAYLSRHPQVTDVLFTGGDPLVMSATALRRYVEPLLQPQYEHVATVRLGTKAISYAPYRFVTSRDADDLLRLFEDVVASGRRLAVMAHVSHPREMEPGVVATAIERIRCTGATIFTQAPVVRHINDDPAVWATMWARQAALDCVPYYMFVERPTGASAYFELPLQRAYEIFRDAYAGLPGLARTVRGPVMSTSAGKVIIDGLVRSGDDDAFVLRYVQARDERLVGRPFLAAGGAQSTWFDQLRPVDPQDARYFGS